MKRLFADPFFFYAFLNVDDSVHREAFDFYEGFDGMRHTFSTAGP
ncbi:MAG TPA: hypothetical protein VHY22_13795 [Chthoniobacteraceae bacterium]|jgi:hypothetical protein|nr:hypothetical protein [Chthoniobacteraceae bacterium]